MQGIGEENAESIVKAKKLILDYSDAFRKEDAAVEVESALARAQGLLHATDPNADVPVKIEAVLPAVDAGKEEAVLFCFALLREARQLFPRGGRSRGGEREHRRAHRHLLHRPRRRRGEGALSRPARCAIAAGEGLAPHRCGGNVEYREEAGQARRLSPSRRRFEIGVRAAAGDLEPPDC